MYICDNKKINKCVNKNFKISTKIIHNTLPYKVKVKKLYFLFIFTDFFSISKKNLHV